MRTKVHYSEMMRGWRATLPFKERQRVSRSRQRLCKRSKAPWRWFERAEWRAYQPALQEFLRTPIVETRFYTTLTIRLPDGRELPALDPEQTESEVLLVDGSRLTPFR